MDQFLTLQHIYICCHICRRPRILGVFWVYFQEAFLGGGQICCDHGWDIYGCSVPSFFLVRNSFCFLFLLHRLPLCFCFFCWFSPFLCFFVFVCGCVQQALHYIMQRETKGGLPPSNRPYYHHNDNVFFCFVGRVGGRMSQYSYPTNEGCTDPSTLPHLLPVDCKGQPWREVGTEN